MCIGNIVLGHFYRYQNNIIYQYIVRNLENIVNSTVADKHNDIIKHFASENGSLRNMK